MYITINVSIGANRHREIAPIHLTVPDEIAHAGVTAALDLAEVQLKRLIPECLDDPQNPPAVPQRVYTSQPVRIVVPAPAEV